MSLSPGFQLGPYKIVSELGKGGMGEVYRAKDARLNREVAIKVLREHQANNPDSLRRFEREAKALAALSHPNILSVFDVGTDQAISFVVMELLEGETLRSQISASGIPWQKASEIAITIADALSAAHSKGVIHRDLKPENIFLTSDDRIKILDFGLARLTEVLPQQDLSSAATKSQELESAISGTVPYMSPEQITSNTADARTDIFSFGCVLYEMLTGTKPFSRSSAGETIAAILKENPQPLNQSGKQIPAELEQIILHCLEKNPDRRFQSARDLIFALRQLGNTGNVKISTARHGFESRRFKLGVIITVLAVLAAGSLLYVFTRPNKSIDSLAVLPFANAGGDPNMEYISDGITESLINNLSQLPQLRVMARPTVFTYKGRDVDPRKVGQELKVRAVLTGKLRLIEDTLVIQGELVDAADGSQLWGEQYSEKFTDILTIQGKISKDIADKLRYRLTGEQEKLLTKHYTENTEAYQLYLKGRFFWNKRSPEGMRRSIDYFHQAIAKDPNYALAYAGLADTYSSLAIVSEIAPNESFPKARAAAAKALELDDTLVEGHAAMIRIKSQYDWDWPGVEKEYRRVMQLNPNYYLAHGYYAGYLMKMGRHQEGIAERNRVLELDPLSLGTRAMAGRDYYLARQYEQAIDQCRKTLEMEPDFFPALIHLGKAYREKGMYQQAIDVLSKTSDLTGGRTESISLIGNIYALTGKKAEAQKALDQLRARSRHHYVAPYHVAVVYAGIEEKDLAFEWLQKAYVDRNELITFIKFAPEFKKLHSDPRFAKLLKQLNLPI